MIQIEMMTHALTSGGPVLIRGRGITPLARVLIRMPDGHWTLTLSPIRHAQLEDSQRQEVVVELPPLPPGDYDVEVMGPGGEHGEMKGGLTVGASEVDSAKIFGRSSSPKPRREWRPDPDYCQPWQLRLRSGGSVCIDDECTLSGGYAHAGPCEPCNCGKEHAIEECPENR